MEADKLDLGRVLPALRRATDPPGAWLAGRAVPENRLVRRAFAPFVHELVALDLDDVRVFVNQGHLDRAGLDSETLFQTARANLASAAASGLRHRDEYGLWHLDAADGYEASRLLLPSWLAAFSDQVEGRPVAIAPTPRVLLVGGDGSLAQLQRMFALSEAVFRRADGPLTPVPFTVDDAGQPVPLALPEAHALSDPLIALCGLLAAHGYTEQATQLLEDPDRDAEVAEIELVHEGLGGAAWTVTRWRPSDRPTLLPVADCVQLELPDGDVLVSWAALEAHAGGCLAPAGLDPARVRARWPGTAALAALRRAEG